MKRFKLLPQLIAKREVANPVGMDKEAEVATCGRLRSRHERRIKDKEK